MCAACMVPILSYMAFKLTVMAGLQLTRCRSIRLSVRKRRWHGRLYNVGHAALQLAHGTSLPPPPHASTFTMSDAEAKASLVANSDHRSDATSRWLCDRMHVELLPFEDLAEDDACYPSQPQPGNIPVSFDVRLGRSPAACSRLAGVREASGRGQPRATSCDGR